MGSQGDAGQFRTPRHIIDFLVAVVDPSKTDTILDPACGTAGFLISAFKHIAGQAERCRSLTPDERKKLIQNFTGYDISPDMVRLSLVNLYLHGFSDPHISEYDTLSSEERWNDSFDVILANPPFMSPKGGIRPHKKFSISSNRSEVLFVDYIAEHLNPKGRAGIIVPEGVIFQSGTAYKDLRKMLVDNYLYAVVSLPAGIFNPYSGVKTSILLMDKAFAKTSNEILFVKVANDGYNLGAQRNAIKGGQLDDAIEVIRSFVKTRCVASQQNEIAHSVPKVEIAKNGDYNLSGERYKISVIYDSNFEFVNLGDVSKFMQGTQVPTEVQITSPSEGYERFIRIIDYTQKNEDIRFVPVKKSNTRCEIDDLIMVRYGEVGFVGRGIQGVYANNLFSITPTTETLSKSFLFNVFKSDPFKLFIEKVVLKSSMPAISHKVLKDFSFPLPPLSVQQEIVAEIDGYQKIIDGAKMVVENYKHKIEIDPEWDMVELDEVCNKITDGSHYSPETTDIGYPYVTVKDLTDGIIDFENCKKIDIKHYSDLLKSGCKPMVKDILFSKDGTVGKTALITVDKEFVVLSSLAIVRPNLKKVSEKYLYFLMSTDFFINKAIDNKTGVAIKRIVLKTLKTIQIPLPDFKSQLQIVAQIEKEHELVNANKQLIEIFEQKIKDRIGRVWGVEET
jgi:type I restriction enzyme M protein